MKETVLRILHSKTTKEPIHAMSRRQAECIFHCSIPICETLLQEEITYGQVISLRIRQLSNPPPEINLRDSYKTVSKLELSCPVEVTWVFSICSILPSLTIVRFGSSCFEFPYGECATLSQSWLTKSLSVKELRISFDHRKLLQDDFDKPRVVQTLNSILNHSTHYFISLVKADLYLPLDVKLDEFLLNNPELSAAGEKREISKYGIAHFQSYSYNDKSKRHPQLTRTDSNGSEPQKWPMKRPRSDTFELSSEGDDLEEPPKTPNYISPPPPRIRSPKNHVTVTPPTPNHNNLPPVSPTPDNSAIYCRRKNGVGEDQNDIHEETTPPATPCDLPEPESDFNQMFTRRRP